jgi:hypothetical protein
VAALIKKSGEFYRRKFDKLRTNENKNKVWQRDNLILADTERKIAPRQKLHV